MRKYWWDILEKKTSSEAVGGPALPALVFLFALLPKAVLASEGAFNRLADLSFVWGAILLLVLFMTVTKDGLMESMRVAAQLSLLFTIWFLFFPPILALLTLGIFFSAAVVIHTTGARLGVSLAIVVGLVAWCGFGLKAWPVSVLLLPGFFLMAWRKGSRTRLQFNQDGVSGPERLSTKQQAMAQRRSVWDRARDTVADLLVTLGWSPPPEVEEDLAGGPLTDAAAKKVSSSSPDQIVDTPKIWDLTFSEEKFLTWSESLGAKVIRAFHAKDLTSVAIHLSDGLYEHLAQQIAELSAVGIRWDAKNASFTSCYPDQFQEEGGFDLIHVAAGRLLGDQAIDSASGNALSESGTHQLTEYWTFVRKTGVATLGYPDRPEGSCPNCGNILRIGKWSACQACGSFLRSGSYDWILTRITPAGEWKPNERREIPGWKAMQTRDPELSTPDLEDRAAMVFWRLRQAQRLDRIDLVRPFALPDLLDRLAATWRSEPDGFAGLV